MDFQPLPTERNRPNERRAKPRINCTYPVVLRTHLNRGEKTESQGTITNISASGFYLRTHNFIPRGQNLFLMARLSNLPANKNIAPNLAATGQVVRVEPKPDGSYGVAIQMQRYRLVQ